MLADVQHISDDQRRRRLAARHALAPAYAASDVVAATRAVTVLHSTEPASVPLALQARVPGASVADVDRALHDERSLVKQLAMRRTLFVFPRDLLPAAWGSAAARVATQQRALLAKDVERHGVADDGARWVERACAAVLERLADGGASAQELREQLPELAGMTQARPDKKYVTAVPFAPRVLTLLGAQARVVRGRNTGHWRQSRPTWELMETWLGEPPAPLDEAAGYAELVRRWLFSFGPGTEVDLVWWLGATKTAVRRALTDVGAEPVTLDGGATGWVLPGDEADLPEVGPWAALLPVLDPTVMGWKERAFYLGGHAAALFDSNGNAGTTAWWNGRIVGCWTQDAEGVVRVHPCEPIGAHAREALESEAIRLTAWLDGVRVGTVYSSPAMKSAAPA